LRWNEVNAPLKRNVTSTEVGHAALFLLSGLGSGVSGEVLHVDSGYHTVGMVAVDNTQKLADLVNDMNKTANS
jgi:enoyl-[acyl-carrier protein] reductase I